MLINPGWSAHGTEIGKRPHVILLRSDQYEAVDEI